MMDELNSGTQSLLSMPGDGVYAITPEHLSGTELLAAAQLALEGGCVLLQYRAKPPMRDDAEALQRLCRQFDVPLIINDDLELAEQLGLGVHLGEHDGAITAARQRLGPDAIIGASCYDSLVLADRAVESGASYVAFGSFFTSPSKNQPRRASTALLQKAGVLAVPCVAIGGIELANAAPLVAAGANYLATISGIFSQPDIRAATAALSALFEKKND